MQSGLQILLNLNFSYENVLHFHGLSFIKHSERLNLMKIRYSGLNFNQDKNKI